MMDAKKTEREREEIQRCSYSYSMHLKSSEERVVVLTMPFRLVPFPFRESHRS